MMKTFIKSILLSGLFILAFNSCSLNEYNPSGANANIVYSTEEGFEYLVNSAYYNFRAQFYGREDIMFLGEGGTDIWHLAGKGTHADQLLAYTAKLDATTGQIKNTWQRFYEIVNYANAGLGRIDDVTFKDPQTKLTKEGELRFIRAYAYWAIAEFFGGVTLRTEETEGAVMTGVRSPLSDFYELIITDLERAKEILPITQTEYGRADRKAAYGLLARTSLTRASYLEYFENNKTEADKFYKKVLDAADYLITNRTTLGCKLYDSFEELFDPANNKTNEEALWAVTHSTNSALNPQSGNPNRMFMWYIAKYTSLCGMPSTEVTEYGRDNNRRLMPTRYLLELFDEEKDGRYYGSFREEFIMPAGTATYTWKDADITTFKKNFTGTLPSINAGERALLFTKKKVADKATLPYGVKDIDDTYNADGSISDDASSNIYYPSLKKFRDPDRSPNSNAGTKNVIVMRLAEMYLAAAEASFKLGDSETAAGYINVLRRRAAVKTPVDYTNDMLVTKDDISLDFLLDERARELCGELLRWFDLKRTKQLENRLGPGKANPDIVSFNPDKHYLRPVPQAEIDALGGNYDNNPGY
ncbi:MAG: RagB/SusD family nutrient uptake outer membrane protein [Bacteroides sp.]|nr:RagB/SusD family nutrient uptake outer membrane protein [Bacteroides sp.]